MTTPRVRLPAKGIDRASLLAQLHSFGQADVDWRGGRAFSMVYFAGDEHLEFLKKAHNAFFSENALNPMAFQSLRRMELEVVQMTASMLHGGPEAVGTMTTGGTESLLMAVKTYRDRARARRKELGKPNIVAPETLHVAVDKACHYFDVELIHTPVTGDYAADVTAMRKAITRDTILLMASAPQYPHGILDPIAEVGALAEEKKLPFHVDACIGGWVLPWVEKLGRPVAPWDFRVPGVTSISADLHKYAYGVKGASTVIYRDMKLLKHQFYVATDWPGGIYASPSMPGTRSGGVISASWAALNSLGESGYLELTRNALEATDRLREGLSSIDGIEVLGDPVATLFAWRSKDPGVDTFAVADQLADRGWSIDRQQNPSCVHCTVTGHHAAVVESYLDDVRAAVRYVRSHPEARARGNAAMYGMMARVPFRGMIKQSVTGVMEQLYGTGGLDYDPSKLGAPEGLAGKLVERLGDVAMSALDRAAAVRKRLRGLLR